MSTEIKVVEINNNSIPRTPEKLEKNKEKGCKKIGSDALTPPSTIPSEQRVSTASLEFQSDAEKSSNSEVSIKAGSVKEIIANQSGEPSDKLEMKTLLNIIDTEVDTTVPTLVPPMVHSVAPQETSQFINNFSQRNRNYPRLHHLYENRSFRNHQGGGDYCRNNNGLAPQHGELKVTISQTLYVPVKKYPKYNFVGRILGPRGMTVKQLEKETECKIFVRGRASNVSFNPHTKMLRGGVISNKTSLSTISQSALTDEPLHVYIECFNYQSIAAERMKHAVSIMNDLLSPPVDGKDELKRQQLVDISLINGTYRPTNTFVKPPARLGQSDGKFSKSTVDPTSSAVSSENIGSVRKDSSVYRVPQQKRTWHKPRGPDATTEEFAKSVASREFVTEIVSKTKQTARPTHPVTGNTETFGCSGPLSPTTVNKSLNIANNLLQSYDKMSFVPTEDEPKAHLQPIQSSVVPLATNQMRQQLNCYQYDFPFMPIHPPMHPHHDFPTSNPNSYFYQNPNFVDFYPFYPPPHPFPVPFDSSYQMPGIVYMLPGGFNSFEQVAHRQ